MHGVCGWLAHAPRGQRVDAQRWNHCDGTVVAPPALGRVPRIAGYRLHPIRGRSKLLAFVAHLVGKAATTRDLASMQRLLRNTWLVSLLGAPIIPVTAHATVFMPSFAGPSLDAGLAAFGSAGTSYQVGGGALVLEQAAGEGNGDITVSTASTVTGDITATVSASRVGLGRADLGLVLGTPDWSRTFADVFFNGVSSTVNGNIFQPAFKGAFISNSSDELTLTITREGDVLNDIIDAGTGPVLINTGSDPNLSGPVNIGLFLLEAAGDTGEHQGTFNDFQIAPVPVPEPTSLSCAGIGFLALALIKFFNSRKIR